MPWVTIILSMIASTCLTLATIYGLAWFWNRASWAQLAFAVAAVSTAAFAFCELRTIRVQTLPELFAAMGVGHVSLFVWLASMTWFVWFYLGAGRLWLAWTICGLRALYLLLNFVSGPSINYREVTSLQTVSILGERIVVSDGVPNPWMLVGNLSVLLLIIFVADACAATWRRGDHRKALMVGVSVEVFLVLGLIEDVLIFWGNGLAPIIFSPLFLGVLAVMAHELSISLFRAPQLLEELQVSQSGLHESEERLSLAIDAVDFGVWTSDLASGAVWASEKYRQLFGFTLSEELDRNALLGRLHPDDHEDVLQAHARAVTDVDQGRYQAEYRLMQPDGTIRWIASLGRVERDATGRPVLMRGVCREITAGKRMEHETFLLRQELAHAGRVSTLAQLATGLAHELSQPLSAILRNAEAGALLLRTASPSLDDLNAILVDIRKDDERAGNVIDRMRRLLKRQTLAMEPLSVGSVVDDVVGLVRADAASRQVNLHLNIPVGLPQIRGDRVQLQQVLLNLVLNGMDALNGTQRRGRGVNVAARLESECLVEVAVSDDGPGIANWALANLFDPFFTTKPGGMGLGLPISRAIVEAHGGRLWAADNTGGGAVFCFTLPVADIGIAAD